MKRKAVVIGGGHNGLVAALRLARRGWRVTVLERRAAVGGLAAAREFHPGYTAPGIHHDTRGFEPALARALGLHRHGLAFRPAAPEWWAAPGFSVTVPGDAAGETATLASVTGGNAPELERRRAWLARVGGALRSLLRRPPPPLPPTGAADLATLARVGLGLRRLGRGDLEELLRIAPMSVADWLEQSLGSGPAAAAAALPGVFPSFTGPHSGGTAANLLLHEVRRGAEIVGGPAALVRALLTAAAEVQIEVRCDAEVERIEVAAGPIGSSVCGVVLAGGERVAAERVLLAGSPRRGLLDLLPPGCLPLALEEAVARVRVRGVVAVVNMALSGKLEEIPTEATRARIVPGGIGALERAFDAAKYGECSKSPALLVSLPARLDADLAPAGGEVVSILAAFAPQALRGGWNEAARERLSQSVVAALEAVVPEIGALIVGREVLTPVDLEREWALPGGHLWHGEQALDQLAMMRPCLALSQYKTPIAGLFLAGSGSHPGGGVSGLPGYLGAAAALRHRD